MDKKLFEEEVLTRNLPKEVLDAIDAIDSKSTQHICDHIFNSDQMDEFLRSVCLPKVEETDRTSVLLEEAKTKMKGLLKKRGK